MSGGDARQQGAGYGAKSRGVAVRAGHHCCKPAHARFGVQASCRASSYLYTTPGEIDALVEGLNHTKRYFRVDG